MSLQTRSTYRQRLKISQDQQKQVQPFTALAYVEPLTHILIGCHRSPDQIRQQTVARLQSGPFVENTADRSRFDANLPVAFLDRAYPKGKDATVAPDLQQMLSALFQLLEFAGAFAYGGLGGDLGGRRGAGATTTRGRGLGAGAGARGAGAGATAGGAGAKAAGAAAAAADNTKRPLGPLGPRARGIDCTHVSLVLETSPVLPSCLP